MSAWEDVPATRWRWPRLRLRPALKVFAFGLALGVWQGSAVRLMQLMQPHPGHWAPAFIWEVTSALVVTLILPILMTAVLNAPSPRVGWARFLGIHAAAFLLFTSLHILGMAGLRHAVYALLELGDYDLGPPVYALPMEAQKDLISYGLGCAVISLLYEWRERQARALRSAELEGELRAAQLQSLTGQLHPHFLFNALHTIGSVMYEDLPRTDRLLSDLGQLLRASLERTEPTWTLAEERGHTERFVALLAARFGDRLEVRWDVAPGLETQRVPCFALQTLVENAVKHNQDLRGALEVRIRARAEADRWALEVEDTGRGFGAPSPASGPGVGLTQLARVLTLLHGERARLEQGAGPEGGARVTVWLPRVETS
ncbi:sensor histidine kinase [Corallococcus sp. AB049A]|uniref:Sensor histidine kinase n=1 Tax=Corallococcus interemptor TaxID=2316720 RepID=A0A3A8PLN6_9BACT|nr:MULTISPECIES: histidine kinase [Corallococcus]RKH38512.1 sensor histidine kinase [Corallococcus sp. AB050B]RKH57307.1 sensor histidine kinase [Corallococcus interemptor]RKI48128.1 sensor histidine kinase [Corallococcus sp. AB049A]